MGIAKPMASRKLTKKLYKCVRKASKGDKNQFYRGIKSVLKAIKKGESGFVLFAGDTEPVEIICHLPLVCEEVDVPYFTFHLKQLLVLRAVLESTLAVSSLHAGNSTKKY